MPRSRALYLAGDKSLASHYLRVESERLHIKPAFSIMVQEVPGLPDDGRTLVLDASGTQAGPETHCEVQIGGVAHESGEARATMAHEVFHCLEGQLGGTIARYSTHGAWLIEGAAAWVESDLIADDSGAQSYWCAYLASPETPLFDRSGASHNYCADRDAYSAIGFFGHLAASGISPWHVFAAMFSAAGDTAAYQASGAISRTFLDTEASAFFDDPSLGSGWSVGNQGSAIADGNVRLQTPKWPEVSVKDGDTKALVVKPYADDPVELKMKAPVLTVSWDPEPFSVPGQVRLHSTKGPAVDEPDLVTAVLCSTKRACASCPDARRFERGDLAITGGPTGETVNLDGGCSLPPRSCDSLLPKSTFPSQGGQGPVYTGYGEVTSDTYGPGTSSSECDIGPTDQESTNYPATLAFVLLVSYPSSKRATAAYGDGGETPTLIADPSDPYSLSPLARVDIGDAANTYTFQNQDGTDSGDGGGLRVDNDVFFFTCHESDGGMCPSASGVLEHVGAELG